MINFSRKIEEVWYGHQKPAYLLIILSNLFSLLVKIRSSLYASKILTITKVEVPVIVIGNITAGGTGKTPVTLFLSQWFTKSGKKVGIISRGYKGIKNRNKPKIISKDEKAKDYGDEAVYMARESKALVCVCKDKLKAAKLLVKSGAEIIISDDGLQHYSLARDHEIAVIDSSRPLGNGYFLPAGPLRESTDRLKNVDLVLLNGRSKLFPKDDFMWHVVHSDLIGPEQHTPVLHFDISNDELVDLNNGSKHKLEEFKVNEVRVLAGIGNPEKLYRKIEEHGMTVKPIITEDHGMVNLEDYSDEKCPLLITPKDAVKYDESFPQNTYLLHPEIEIDTAYLTKIFGQYL